MDMGKDGMRNTMRTTSKVWLFVFVFASAALAQNFVSPKPAVSGPAYDLSIGYANLTMAVASAGHANLSGVDASGTVALSERWGAVVDTSYLRTSNLMGTTHQGYMLNVQTGPVFYALQHGNTRVFLRALGGGAIVDGAVPINENSYFHGWLARPSYAFGGGFERPVSQSLTLRFSGDYLRTSFYDSTGSVAGQNNLRVTASFVFRLKERLHRSNREPW